MFALLIANSEYYLTACDYLADAAARNALTVSLENFVAIAIGASRKAFPSRSPFCCLLVFLVSAGVYYDPLRGSSNWLYSNGVADNGF